MRFNEWNGLERSPCVWKQDEDRIGWETSYLYTAHEESFLLIITPRIYLPVLISPLRHVNIQWIALKDLNHRYG